MKLATFTHNQETRVGAVVDGFVVDSKKNTKIPATMLEFLSAGVHALEAMRQQIECGEDRIALEEVKLCAPVPRPGKYLGVALNYADHIEETGRDKPEYPSFFTKQSTCVIGHRDAIHRPKVSDKLDYEGELAFVIGTRCRHVPVDKAHRVIAGFPLGPWLVTSDEIGDPHNLNLKTWIDDDLRQNANTRHMIFNCYEMIAYLSQAMTLEPGDVITTGTPSGVGVKMNPRGYMLPGQTARIEIEGIGTLVNPVIEEPEGLGGVQEMCTK
jgi:2-keto-4-pentenoate hydratase/2-oxohepta-3-ene-1,7-dioic acid hydratase in catechol pathway